MVKVFINSNSQTPTGYELVDGDVTTPITTIVDDGKTLKLPANSSNRQYWSIAKVLKGEVELTYKETRTLNKGTTSGTPSTPAVKSTLEEDLKYLTEDEANTLKSLMAKIKKAKMKAKLEAEIARLEEELKNYEEEA